MTRGQVTLMPPRALDPPLDMAEDFFYRERFHAVGNDRILADVGVTSADRARRRSAWRAVP